MFFACQQISANSKRPLHLLIITGGSEGYLSATTLNRIRWGEGVIPRLLLPGDQTHLQSSTELKLTEVADKPANWRITEAVPASDS